MGDSQGERKDKVHVVVRVRPLIERELIDTDAILAKQSWKLDLTSISNKDCNYRFDKVYGENSTTETIYKDVVAPMVQAAFKGFNGTILCYGQTSSGKTHTLYGSDKDPGIIGYFAEQVSRYLQTQEETDDTVANKENSPSYVIELNLIEIYNEVVKDLLDSENPIDLIEKDGAVVPKSVKNINVMQPGDIKAAAERLQRERKLGETRMNKSSSRSHTILRVKITSLEKPGGDEECPSGVGVGILNFVDLAGSEKLSQTGAVGDRLKEAININTSLSALSRVVMQLSAAQKVTSRDSSSMTTPSCNSVMSTKQPKSRLPPHISYRDSKLTRLLQSSLGGNAHVAIVCNVTPASIEETKSTLVFANNAKSIQIKPTRTYLTKTTDATAYQRYIEELQTQLSGKDKEVSQLKKQLEAMEQLDRKSRKDAPLCDAEEMRRKTFHASLPQRRVRASEGFMDGRKFASLELCSSQRSVWNESLHPNFESSKGTDPASLESLEVIEKIDQESQTSEDLNPSPAKKRRLDNNVPGTPVATLRMQRSLLSQTNDADRHCWEDEKSFLQNELAELKQENEEMKEKLGSHQALEVSKQELKRQLDESTSKFSKEFEDLKFQHSKKVEELKSSKEFEVDTLNAQITKKDGIIKELRQHLEELQTTAQVEESQLDVDVGGKAYNIANESFGIGPITQELIMLKETIEEQERLKAQREERISNLQSKILELKSENLNLSEKLESEMKIAQEQLLAAQSKFEEAVNTKEILQQKYNEVLERNQELAKQAAECKSNCALQIAELKGRNVSDVLKLNEEIAAKERELLNLISKKDDECREKICLQEEEIKNLQSKLKQPLESQSSNSRYTEKLKQDIKTCWEDMKKMETEISELQACIKKQEALIDSRNSEIDELKKSKIAKCSINPEEFEKLKLELGESQSKLNQVENELKSVSAGLEQKLAENRDISTRLEKAQNISRPCTTNRGAQTPVEWSPVALEDYINKMKLHVNKSNFEHAKIVKDLKIKLENYKKDNALEKAANSKEIERLKTVIEDQQLQVTPKTEGVDCEIQCDMMQDLLVRAVKGEKGLLSEKFPEIGRLISENKQKCQRVDLLEKLRTRCTCQDKNSKFSVFKLDHKSQDSQKSDCVEEDSIEKKTGTGKYTLRSRDITGKVAHPGLGIMSAKTSTATKAKASSAFPKKLSYLSGISTLSKSKGKEPVPQKNIQSTKRAFPSEQEDLEVQKVAAATASASQPTTNSQLDQSSSSNGNGNRILTELDNVTSVAEKIQQFNQREKQFSGINERATPCKKKRVDLTEAVTPKKPQVSQETCNSPLITYEELLSLGPPTPAEKKTTSTTKKNSSEEFVFRRLQDISDTEINPDDLFEELLAL